MQEFLAMGGYGAYVWTSFALTFAVLVLNLVLARRRHAGLLLELAERAADGEARAGGGFREVAS